MFQKLHKRIIIITMAVTTTVLVLSGILIMIFSTTSRPAPDHHHEPDFQNNTSDHHFDDEELRNFIQSDRAEGQGRLIASLIAVDIIVETTVLIIIVYASKRIVEPVKNSYERQKIFIANASHELKTPLAVIQANIEALEVDEENQHWKNNIETEINHANKLVLDLLQLAKMDAGSIMKSTTERVNLNAEIKKRIEMFAPKFSGKIHYTSLPGSFIHQLPKQDILQILDILLDNAIKYGKQTLEIHLTKVSLSISNDGTKVKTEDLEKIFDRFYQTDKSKEGSGLGLAIAKTLCDQNGWGIKCSNRNSRTTFTVYFNSKNRT